MRRLPCCARRHGRGRLCGMRGRRRAQRGKVAHLHGGQVACEHRIRASTQRGATRRHGRRRGRREVRIVVGDKHTGLLARRVWIAVLCDAQRGDITDPSDHRGARCGQEAREEHIEPVKGHDRFADLDVHAQRVRNLHVLGCVDGHDRILPRHDQIQVLHKVLAMLDLFVDSLGLVVEHDRLLLDRLGLHTGLGEEAHVLADADRDGLELRRLHRLARDDNAQVHLVAYTVRPLVPHEFGCKGALLCLVLLRHIVDRPRRVQLVLLEHKVLRVLHDRLVRVLAHKPFLEAHLQRRYQLVLDAARLIQAQRRRELLRDTHTEWKRLRRERLPRRLSLPHIHRTLPDQLTPRLSTRQRLDLAHFHTEPGSLNTPRRGHMHRNRACQVRIRT